MWHTQWCTSAPPTPHEIQIDLGASYNINGFQYLPRQDQYFNGDIRNYEFYVSTDGVNWGTPASSGTLITNSADHSLKQVTFAGVNGRYVRFRALSEVNGGPWTSVAELYVLGSAVAAGGPQVAAVMLTPASIAAGGNTSTASVTLTSAPSTDVSISLTSSNPGAATVPATVTVSAGTITASFPVTSASTVSTTVTSVIGAALNGSNGTAILTVTPPLLAPIPQSGWRVLYVDSQETSCTNEAATNAIDGNPATFWHTQFCNSAPPTPHEIQIDLGANYIISGFQYLPRQDQYSNGDIANYEFYVSADGVNWGTPISTGTLITSTSDKTQKQVTFTGVTGRYVRLRALTEVNGGPWTNVAELNVLETTAWSGLLAPGRAIDWSSAGVIGGIPNRTTVCATINPYNGPADAINTAIANCPSGQVVFLNAGTYNLSSGIVVGNQSGVTLRGAGPDQTFLVFSAGGFCNGLGANICVMNRDNNSSSAPHNEATWTGTTEGGAGSYPVGATHLTLGSVTTGSINNLHVGSLLILDQNSDYPNDPGTIYVCDSTGCSQQGGIGCGRPGTNGSPGRRVQNQQVTVTSISGTGPWTIGITPGLYAPNWRSAMSPGAWWSNALPITGVGIENLSADHSGVTDQDGAGIEFANAANSWVKNVRSINAGSIPQHKHVWVYQSSHVTVRDSYFYGSTPASEGYGVDMGCSSSDNLAENNIFQHIAVGTICEDSVGSVFGYNYAIDNYYNNGDPAWQQQDAYHHSAGDNFILWEGQIGSGLALDAIHGSSFMLTSFRNRWSGRDPSLSSGSAKTESTIGAQIFAYNRYANLVGNVFGTAGYHTNYQEVASSGSDTGNSTLGDVSIYTIGYSGNEGTHFTGVPNDTLTASTLLRWGNYDTVSNAVRFDNSEVPSGLAVYANPVPATQALPASFYLAGRPSWFGSVPWPPIGPDVTGGDIPNIGGHAYKIPAQLCYENSAKDANGILVNFNADRCY